MRPSLLVVKPDSRIAANENRDKDCCFVLILIELGMSAYYGIGSLFLMDPKEEMDCMADVQKQLAMDIEVTEVVTKTPVFDATFFALCTIKGLGNKGIRALYDGLYGELGRVWTEEPECLSKILHDKRIPGAEKIAALIHSDKTFLPEKGQDAVEEYAKRRIQVIPLAQLPEQLQKMPDSPRWLCVEGNPQALFGRPAIAVVGTREPTIEGRRATYATIRVLAPYPVTLISGLANGIDAEAHESALASGLTNVAFLGHGVNLVFPKETESIRQRIVECGGAVVSEYLPDETYRKSSFVERNRLQAALADVVIPVEANAQSGTAHTVRFSRQYGRLLIGIRWPKANGILTEFEQLGVPIIDILTVAGRRKLDGLIRDLLDRTGIDSYALSLGEHWLMREIENRAVRRSDFEHIITHLQTELERMKADGDLASGNF